MDRFIVQECLMWDLWVIGLKSNMDRFIDYRDFDNLSCNASLKSNMDRFIEKKVIITDPDTPAFKIQ